jgi:hypothetical protein
MKGQAYFNWIFIIVIGAIALSFFVGFAFQYKELQEKKTELIFLNNLDTSFTNLQSSSFSTSTNLKLPLDFSVKCDNSIFSIFINEKHDVDYIIASKNNIKDNLFIWYKPYSNPFFVTNIYYFTDAEGVNVVTSSQKVKDLVNDMPENFKSKINFDSSTGKRIDVVNDKVIINGVSYDYLGDELIYAAILSDNYPCLVDRFKLKLNEAVITYTTKSNILRRSGCNYNLILSEMNKLNAFDSSAVDRIENLNRDLISKNCPSLY